MRKLILIAALSAGLMACSSDPFTDNEPNTNSNVAVPANPNYNIDVAGNNCGIAVGTALDEKVLLTAETAYNVPAFAYVSFDQNAKVLSPKLKSEIKPMLVQAYEMLKLARQAYNAGNACDLQKYVELTKNISSAVTAKLPPEALAKTVPPAGQ
jgi:hypothetical protein